jgi:hypothetical protein
VHQILITEEVELFDYPNRKLSIQVDAALASHPDDLIRRATDKGALVVWNLTKVDSAQNALSAVKEARTVIERLKARPQSASNAALIGKLEEIAPPEAPAPTGGPRSDAPPAAPTLTNIHGQPIRSVMRMQGPEMPPATAELAACTKQESAYAALMAKWSALKAGAQ